MITETKTLFKNSISRSKNYELKLNFDIRFYTKHILKSFVSNNKSEEPKVDEFCAENFAETETDINYSGFT